MAKITKLETGTISSKEFKKGHSALRITSFLPGTQSQLLLMYLEAVHRSNFKDFRHVFSAASVAELMNIDKRFVGSKLKLPVKQLASTQVDIAPYHHKSPSSYMWRSLFDIADYDNGTFTFEIHQDVRPIVVEAIKSFALVDREVFRLKGTDYGVNLYQYLSRFKGINKAWYPQPISELMYVLGVTDVKGNPRDGKKSYSSPSKFVRFVIERAIKDLHESPDIKKLRFKECICDYTGVTKLGYQEIRAHTGQTARIEKIQFHYEWVSEDEIEEPEKRESLDKHPNQVKKKRSPKKPETPEQTIKRIKTKARALKEYNKKLQLDDLTALRQAYSDLNDQPKMKLIDEAIAAHNKESEDEELRELRDIL